MKNIVSNWKKLKIYETGKYIYELHKTQAQMPVCHHKLKASRNKNNNGNYSTCKFNTKYGLLFV